MLRLTFCALSLCAATAFAAPVVEKVSYEIDGTTYESLLIHDDASPAKRPGIAMVPNWMGITDTAIERAKEIAGTRYAVFLVDMYGVDVRPTDFDQAGKASGEVMKDRTVTRARVNRAIEAFRKSGSDILSSDQVAAIGFCFGGTVALELARSGADVAGVVSFHGNPAPVLPAEKGQVKASVLVLHGADDFFVPEEALRGFESEMKTAEADWTFVSYSGAKHCFAEAEARNEPPGCLYNERAAKRSYRLMNDFLAEKLGSH